MPTSRQNLRISFFFTRPCIRRLAIDKVLLVELPLLEFSDTNFFPGMHELLAPLYFAVHHDAVTPEQVHDSSFNELVDICSADYIAADAWALFNAVMNGVSRWYEWREADPQSGSATNSLASFPNHVVLPANGQTNIQPYVAPIVQACNHIQTNLLQACDPTLWQSIQKAGIEPQIYGMYDFIYLFNGSVTDIFPQTLAKIIIHSRI